MNNALWRMGAFKHKPPAFRYFDPALEEQRTVVMKEVKLPRALETHELCYEPSTRCLFVSQMSNSVLVRIPVGADGLLLDDQDAWNVGPASAATGDGLSGLHSISRSIKHPGCLWLTLQYANELVLLDAATMAVRTVLRVPQLLTRPDGSLARIGGPHCLVECGTTGKIWVALKGSVPCHPGTQGSSARSLAAAVHRVCCNPKAIQAKMEEAARHGGGGGGGAPLAALPEGYAIWRVDPAAYDPKAADGGGVLFECEPSPPMVAVAPNCDCWVVQDRTPKVMHIDARSEAVDQIPIPLADDCSLHMTGPAVMTAPDGAVWSTLLGADGGLVRFHNGKRTMYQLSASHIAWMQSTRFIHLRFVTLPNQWFIFNRRRFQWADGLNCMLLISSNLVEDKAINCITVVNFNPFIGSGWEAPLHRKDIPLPTQDCCCHRIEVISDGADDFRVSAVVSELSSSRVFQIKLGNLEVYDKLEESVSQRVSPCGRAFAVYEYQAGASVFGKSQLKWKELQEESMKAMRLYEKAFDTHAPGDTAATAAPIVLPSRADVLANRRFESAEQQAAFDAFVRAQRVCSNPYYVA